MPPSVCVVIPTYNQAGFIKRAVDSALVQDYPNLQIMVVDDGSSDGTRSKIQAEIDDGRIRYHCHEINRGRASNYRFALNNCTTAEWVVNLDGDDYFMHPGFISEAMKSIQRHGASDVIFFQGAHVLLGDKMTLPVFSMPRIDEAEAVMTAHDYFFGFFDRNSFSHLTTLYKRDLALASGFYESDALSSDLQSFLKLCLNHLDKKVVISKTVFAVWYQHATNSSKSTSLRAHLKNYVLLSRLSKRALERTQEPMACLAWQLRLTVFYLMVYAGLLKKKWFS